MTHQSSRAGRPSLGHDHMDQVAGSSGSRKDDLQPTGNTRKRRRMARSDEPPSTAGVDTSSTADIPDTGATRRQKRRSDHPRLGPVRQRLAPAEKKRKVMRRMEISQLKRELKASQREKEEVEAEWEETHGMMNADLAEVRRELRVISDQSKDSSRIIKEQEAKLESIKEAVCCSICLDSLKDPHSLACGHIACKLCLVKWFYTTAAYLHEVPDTVNGDIPADYDVSHRAKICPTCRALTIRRPTRTYHLDSILALLGISPSAGISAETLDAVEDPWFNLFPVERSSYKITDGGPGYRILRCSECMGELDGHGCDRCQLDYSDSEGGGEVDIEEGNGSEEDDSERDDEDNGQDQVDRDPPGLGGFDAGYFAFDWHAQHQMAAAQAELHEQIRAGLQMQAYQQLAINRLLLQSLAGGSIPPGTDLLGIRAGWGQEGADGRVEQEGDQAEDESSEEEEATVEGDEGEGSQENASGDESHEDGH